MKKLQFFALMVLSACSLTAFNGPEKANELTAQEKKEGWSLLFDGKSTNGWHIYKKGKTPSAWVVQHGELYCKPDAYDAVHGDLVTDKAYANYDLRFDWKISAGGNSGVFINVQERDELPTAWTTGPEYQLLEKSHYDHNANPTKRAGCLYSFYPQKNNAPSKPAGQWNQSRIRQVNGKVEFYLNGVLTAEQDFTTDQWKKMVAQSNFKTFPEFGKHIKGSIALQDWAKGISFRNIKIKQL